MARSGLYIKTLSDTTLRNSDSDITDFHDSCATANIGKLMRANNALAGWYFVSEMGWYPTMDEEAVEEYLDTLDVMTTGIVPEDALRDVLKIGLEKYLDESTVIDSMSYKITDLMQELFPDSTFDIVEVKNPFYTSGQLSALVTIAEECPYEYGPAVFMARAMLSKNDTVPYPYYHTCEASPEPAALKWDGQNEPGVTGNTVEEELNIKVYPNPTENELFVEIRGDEVGTASFELWNVIGQKSKVLSLNLGSNKLNLDELGAGIYQYEVYINGERKQSGKQIIVRK
jgi:hypothetical protein